MSKVEDAKNSLTWQLGQEKKPLPACVHTGCLGGKGSRVLGGQGPLVAKVCLGLKKEIREEWKVQLF